MLASIVISGFIGIAGLIFTAACGLAGVTGWLTGITRKSIAEAQKAALDAQGDQLRVQASEIASLKEAVKACAERDEAKAAAIQVIMDQLRGGEQLTALAAQIVAAVHEGALMHAEVLAVLSRIEARMDRR